MKLTGKAGVCLNINVVPFTHKHGDEWTDVTVLSYPQTVEARFELIQSYQGKPEKRVVFVVQLLLDDAQLRSSDYEAVVKAMATEFQAHVQRRARAGRYVVAAATDFCSYVGENNLLGRIRIPEFA